MTDLRTAAQQALKAMEKATRFMSDADYRKLNESIENLRAALAEPVQEPVYLEVRCAAHPKWMRVDEQQFDEYVAHGWEGQKLYTAPPKAEPVDVGLLEYRGNSVAFIYQKMTAYQTGIDAAWDVFRAKGLHPDGKTSLTDMIAKHTAPPQRKPLTDEEIQAIWAKTFEMGSSANTFARAIERAHGIGGSNE